MDALIIGLQLGIVIACLLVGTKYGGMGLGLISGFGLLILVFGFQLKPGHPPVDVMMTILAVIGCASVLQAAGGLDVMMRSAEKLLRAHPTQITVLAPLTTWFLTLLCGTGHVVYTMFPIIEDIALEKNIRPERPMAVSSVAAQVGITASPVSVATVSLAAILGTVPGGPHFSILQILSVSIPASLLGVILAALWSMRRGKDLDDDPEFQEKIADPEKRAYIYGRNDESTLLDKELPRTAYWATWIFFGAIAVTVLLGAFSGLRPSFLDAKGKLQPLSMTLTIQILMLLAGALILILCKVKSVDIPNTGVFKAGMVAIFSVFGVAWMAETFFGAHIVGLQAVLTDMVKEQPWSFAVALFLVSKLVNSQAAALVAMAPIGLKIGVDPVMMVGFFGASYGYFFLPTYPSDVACIGFDRTGTTRIGKYILNHSFMIPGFICVITSVLVGTALARLFLG
ncbi:anaerobic C4-dicarboxylate transporter DcuB [Austwickia chelonae]|uniref:Anaerobic C4-dicarboxylate transporter n=1 Tax=Austwickia chelonae NBRC 105200 TaxID=1184607 RepID=K6VB60_9MICO|nr:anaerobic C4-dicarboxylate transporter [Austwickia chelonae]GAB79478.1 anaerobic C4-dicarboxylate transporter [Austwickia chelonae NBRC 105200]SEW38516.1 anaerobic C4-dicarboxylate transporter DcuB [Austwickia chelonae]